MKKKRFLMATLAFAMAFCLMTIGNIKADTQKHSYLSEKGNQIYGNAKVQDSENQGHHNDKKTTKHFAKGYFDDFDYDDDWDYDEDDNYDDLESNVGTIASGETSVSNYRRLAKFTYDGSSIVYGQVDVQMSNAKNSKYAEDDDISFYIYDMDEDEVIKNIDLTDHYVAWHRVDERDLQIGTTYGVYVDNNSAYKYDVKYRIKGYEDYASSFTVNKGAAVQVKARGSYYFYNLVGTKSNTLAYATSCTSSDKSIATGECFGDQIAIDAKKRGTCTLTIKTYNGATRKVTVKVANGTPELEWIGYKMNIGQSFTNKVWYTDQKVKWSSTNSKVAKVSSKGKVTATGIGTCYVKASVAGKTLKCKVIVERRWPNFGAYLYDYNTRNNYFVVKFKNKATRSVFIKSGIKVQDVDYKSFDRNVYLKKSVTIKPGETKYVRFYVKGSNTWYDPSDFTLFYKFSYDGATYEGHVWGGDSVFKKGKSWYATYWDDAWYETWY